MIKCSKCGNTDLFYAKLKGVQYYNSDGETEGYDVYTQGSTVYCHRCNSRVCKTSEVVEKGNVNVRLV